MRTVLKNAALAVFDFDNTVADTFAPSPRGIDVQKAYSLALERLFGERCLLARVGGLKNRAPTELVRDIVAAEPRLVANAMRNYEVLRSEPRGLMPKGKGVPLVPIKEGNYLPLLGEMLVRLKLEHLIEEVGPAWPRPFEGVLELFDELRAHGKRLALITSGHDPFIRKCFGEWGVACPELVLSDDILRPLPGPLSEKMKPSKMLIHYLLMMAHQCGISVKWDEIVYFGDDFNKDGGLARNADLPFGWYNPKAAAQSGELRSNEFAINSWQEVRATLH